MAKNPKPPALFLFYAAAGLAAAVFFHLSLGYSKTVITDEDILQSFGRTKSHRVMTRQMGRLEEILRGFLTGNFAAIEKHAREVNRDMFTIMDTIIVKESEDEQASEWKITSAIVNSATALVKEAKAENYEKSYAHFMALTRQCIECHQAARSWGTFPKPPAPKPVEKQNK